MTTIHSYNTQVDRDGFARAVKSFSSSSPRTAGVEMERFMLKSDGSLPDKTLHDILYTNLFERLGKSGVSVEPSAHMIEIMSKPHTDADSVVQEMRNNISVLHEEAGRLGLEVVPSSDLPNIPLDRLLHNFVNKVDPVHKIVRRAYELPHAYKKHGWDNIMTYSCTTTSMHFTHSVQNANQLHRWAKVHYALSPLYYTIFENRTRDAKGKHAALSRRKELGERGLVADYVFDSYDGDEFIERYVQFVSDTVMPAILDEKGNNETLEKPLKFDELPQDRHTLGNFLQAASFAWNVCKLKPIIDPESLEGGDLRLKNLLLEVRDFDSSEGSLPVIAHWLCALTQSEENLVAVENALEELGMPICTDPKYAKEKINEALAGVESTRGYLNIPYGTRENGTLRDLIGKIVLPVLIRSGGNVEQIKTWHKISKASDSIFRAVDKQIQKMPLKPILRPRLR
ncbi:MAG: hypothetical protein MRY79_00135 [Alphaproteobacteria bacterium]|nr:hypothetical protein [Alphaproteobacteria bacterium]